MTRKKSRRSCWCCQIVESGTKSQLSKGPPSDSVRVQEIHLERQLQANSLLIHRRRFRHMANDHYTFKGLLASIGLFILVSFVFAGFFDDYLSDESSPFVVVLFLVFLGVALYVEYQKEQAKEKEGKGYHWFSKETHDLWNSKDTKGKVVYVLGNIMVAIISVVLVVGVFFILVAWFFSQLTI